MKLLSRNDFREQVFSRDNNLCVVCAEPAQDAHHIMERRLFPDGGYYIDNGASLCASCHIKAEGTVLSPDFIREKAGIHNAVLPPHLYSDEIYDKWGNIILPNGTRLKGELFYDESVQKILKEHHMLVCFTKYVKYPRTYHLPWTQCSTKDDRILPNCQHFEGKEVVVTTKMDGENQTIYNDYVHARSVNSESHPSRNWVKNFASTFSFDIPEGWRICGENLFMVHSIKYENLSSYFLGFSMWNDKNVCLPWDETLEWFSLLGIEHVPILYRGLFSEEKIRSLWKEDNREKMEGYVVRLAESFSYKQFRDSVAKFVRKDHVQGVIHCLRTAKIEKNELVL